MQTKVMTTTDELAKIFRVWSHKAKNLRIVTAWATTECALLDTLRKARGKISTLVVGLDFHSTSPAFLEEFWSSVRVGAAPNGGTFHPKLYLFRNDKAWCCITGSSNFTGGGFGDNSELNICIEGKTSEPFFQYVSKYIDRVEKESDKITSSVFEDYKDRYIAFRLARRRLAKFTLSKRAKLHGAIRKTQEQAGKKPPEQLNKNWREFIEEILQGKRRKRVVNGEPTELSYLETAERSRDSFTKYAKLARMPLQERQFIGGTIAESGWFGSMKGAGEFKRLLNRAPESLDAALDRIPQEGAVSEKQFSNFSTRYAGERAGVATGSRLLAMKRPDLFVCVDSKNRASIAKAFGLPASQLLAFEGYWELIQRIWACPWWKTPEPKNSLQKRIWKSRVALLDSLYYLGGTQT